MVRLSVIVPIYNVEAYLAECLDSVFSQPIEDMELIAVIDGSPDKSGDIAKEYAAVHPNMRVIEQENRGPSAARNRGIREALGEYVCWMDSDDLYTPSALADAYRMCVENDLDFIGMAFHQFPYDYEKAPPADGSVSPVMDGREFIRYTSERNYLIQWPQNYVYKRSFLLANDLFFAEGCVFEGSPFAIHVSTVADRCMYCNSPLTEYRIRNDSLSHAKRTAKTAHSILSTLVLMIDACETADIPAEYMPYFSDTLCKRACFCATTYAELSEKERIEYKAMCTPRELMFFHTFVSPISYRNWLVKKAGRSADELGKKYNALSRQTEALKKESEERRKTIAAQRAEIAELKARSHVARAFSRKETGAAGILHNRLPEASELTYIEYLTDTRTVEAVPMNSLYPDRLGNIVSTEAIISRYRDLFPTLFYHLIWRDSERTPLSLSACGERYGDSFDDVIALLSDGSKYSLLPSYFTDRKSISIRREDDSFLWNEELLSSDELLRKLKGIGYDAVIAEELAEDLLSISCLYDDRYLDVIVLGSGSERTVFRVTDAYLVVRNARANETEKGCDVYSRLSENTGRGLFGLPGDKPCEISVPGWRPLCKTLCGIAGYLSVYNGIQFRIRVTTSGPKIIRMSAYTHLPAELCLSNELNELKRQVSDRRNNPTQEHAENERIYAERKEYWENDGSKRHWHGFRPYMAMLFDRELEADSADPGISDEDKLWCYKRGFFSYRIPEIGLCEDNYRKYISDYEYFWVNRINNSYQNLISSKLSIRFTLDSFRDRLPEYYYSVRSFNGEKRIIALPDLPAGYTQSLDSVIRLVKTKKQLAVKPEYGTHGDGFVKFTYDNGQMYLDGKMTDKDSLEQFFFAHEGIFLITEYVGMHPYIAAMYPESLNTVRVNCMNRAGDRGIIGACLFRVGHSGGGYTDNINTAAGGIVSAVDKTTGKILKPEFRRDSRYSPCPVHPDTGTALEGTIPHWDMIIDGVKRIANELPQLEYMGFDIAVTPEAFKVIEINVFPDYTKFVLLDDTTQAFLRHKVECKKKTEHIPADRRSWLD